MELNSSSDGNGGHRGEEDGKTDGIEEQERGGGGRRRNRMTTGRSTRKAAVWHGARARNGMSGLQQDIIRAHAWGIVAAKIRDATGDFLQE